MMSQKDQIFFNSKFLQPVSLKESSKLKKHSLQISLDWQNTHTWSKPPTQRVTGLKRLSLLALALITMPGHLYLIHSVCTWCIVCSCQHAIQTQWCLNIMNAWYILLNWLTFIWTTENAWVNSIWINSLHIILSTVFSLSGFWILRFLVFHTTGLFN